MIVPRWEWRTFSRSFGTAEERFAVLSPELVQESDELYLLSEAGGDTVKVREGKLDVKHLERVNGDGLEQWLPVLKAEFPVPAGEVASVLASLRVAEAPSLARDSYTLSELLDEVVRPSADLLAVEVHKRRERFTINGCTGELTEVRTARGSTRTIAFESDDADRVMETVRDLGLASRPNVSYPRGLKTLVLFGTLRYAVVDVGTNSVKFHIGERRPDGAWEKVVDRAEITRLGEGLEGRGTLSPESIERTIEAIAEMAEEATRNGAESIAAVGTAGLRTAADGAAFVDVVQARAGVRIEIISGEEEARLAYLAATSGLDIGGGSLVVFDTGGGSSQFTFGHGERVDEQFSVSVGAARFTERYGLDGPVPDETLAAALEAIASDLSRLDGRPTPDTLVAIGGAATNLAAVKHELASYDPAVVQGTVLDVGEVDRQIELYRTHTAAERRQVAGLQPKRAEVILAGACVIRTVLAKLGRESLVVSDRGLRHGVLVERFQP